MATSIVMWLRVTFEDKGSRMSQPQKIQNPWSEKARPSKSAGCLNSILLRHYAEGECKTSENNLMDLKYMIDSISSNFHSVTEYEQVFDFTKRG